MIDVSIISKIVSRKTEGEKIGKTPSAPGYFLEKSIWDSIFELKVDTVGNRYLFGKLPLAIQYGITMFAEGDIKIPSLLDSIPIASTSAKGLAYFDPNYFSVGNDGKVSLIVGGQGIDETELEAYLTSNNYAKKSDIPSLVGYATESWVNTRIDSLINGAPAAYDTLKEIADVLQGNVNSIGDIITALGTKWTQDNTKIANWDTAYSWGNHANAGYALKTYVDSELTKYVTLSGEQTISGKKNFTTGGLFINGSQIIYDSTKKYWKLEGDLLVTGGITMYGDSVSGGSAGATTLGQLQNVGNWADSVADVDRIMYQAAGSYNWVAKSLSSIGGGGGSFSGGVITGSGYNVLVVNRTDRNRPTIGFQYNGSLYGYLGFSSANYPVFISSVGDAHQLLHSANYSNYALSLTGGTITVSSYEDFIIKVNVNGGFSGITYSNSNEGALGYIGVGGADSSYPYQPMFVTRGKQSYPILHENNYSSYALPLTGGTLTSSNHNVLDLKSTSAEITCVRLFRNSELKSQYGYYTSGKYSYFSNETNRSELRIYDDTSIRFTTDYNDTSKLYTIWHSGNDGSGSGLDADLLDGYHVSNFMTFKHDGNNYVNASFTDTNLSKIAHDHYIEFWDSSGGWFNIQCGKVTAIAGGFVGNLSGNASSATKLQTARTIWGQTFDGTGNVDGNINMNGSAVISIASSELQIGAGTFKAYNSAIYGSSVMLYSGGTNFYPLILHSSGNVGVGTTNPSYKTHIYTSDSYGLCIDRQGLWKTHISNDDQGGYIECNGVLMMNFNYPNSQVVVGYVGYSTINLLVTGGITMYSDKRKKTILGNVELSLKQIANAPLIEHYYNSDDAKTTHVGSIAQYWASMNDWFCKLDNEGFYTMEIQNCALASAISIARELDRYESKTDKTIKQLKKRICQLEEEVERLRAS